MSKIIGGTNNNPVTTEDEDTPSGLGAVYIARVWVLGAILLLVTGGISSCIQEMQFQSAIERSVKSAGTGYPGARF